MFFVGGYDILPNMTEFWKQKGLNLKKTICLNMNELISCHINHILLRLGFNVSLVPQGTMNMRFFPKEFDICTNNF